MNFAECREHHFCSVLGEGSCKKLEWLISVCHSTMTLTANKVNLISKWFVIIGWACLVENWVPILFGKAWSLSLDAMPGDLDLYVYLNIEMVIVLLQLIFSAMPICTLNPFSVVIVGSLSGGFYHSVIGVRLSNFLLIVFGLCIIYILHYIFYICKSLLIVFFSYDFVLVFIAKALLFSSVIFKSYSYLRNPPHN